MLSTSTLSLSILSLALAIVVRADVTPNEPGPGDSYNEGSTCHIDWSADTTGSWKDMTIELMTGGNFDMVSLGSIATGLDGTSSPITSYDFPCPQVTPNSAIYFYQFTASGTSDTQWTTRFTIAGKDGSSTKPLNTTTLDGETVECGYGSLVGSSFAVSSASSSSGSSDSPSSAPTTSAASPVATPGTTGASGPSGSAVGTPASGTSTTGGHGVATTASKLVTSIVSKATGSSTAGTPAASASGTSAASAATAGVVFSSMAIFSSLAAVTLTFSTLL